MIKPFNMDLVISIDLDQTCNLVSHLDLSFFLFAFNDNTALPSIEGVCHLANSEKNIGAR